MFRDLLLIGTGLVISRELMKFNVLLGILVMTTILAYFIYVFIINMNGIKKIEKEWRKK
jgi:hypothetical protein